MNTQITPEEMFEWIKDNVLCSNHDIPEWLIHLSQNHTEIDGGTNLYLELMTMARFRAIANEREYQIFEFSQFSKEIVSYLNEVDYIINIESMRRKGDFFQMHISDIFSLGLDSLIVIEDGGKGFLNKYPSLFN